MNDDELYELAIRLQKAKISCYHETRFLLLLVKK